MMIFYITVFFTSVNVVLSYNNKMFTLTNYENTSESQCGVNHKMGVQDMIKLKLTKDEKGRWVNANGSTVGFSFITVSIGTTEAIEFGKTVKTSTGKPDNVDHLAHWPTGHVMRAEMFQGRGSVHLPFLEYMHRGHSMLKVTGDYMQTAVDAFAIFISGDISDVLRLPGSYVLQSARTISMMRVAHEKLAATWAVVKGSTPTNQITYDVLEKYRPLFKYINGREMARLNLSDNKILSFIGTHPDLNRHQVGVIANKYIHMNPRWTEAKYLNIMNNLLCGVPMIFMRRIPENTYLQLTHQIFYHIRACDPLQRRFYLAMMMRTQALGKSYSWSAREVSRLGLLLAEVTGPDLSAINPEAMSGLTAQVEPNDAGTGTRRGLVLEKGGLCSAAGEVGLWTVMMVMCKVMLEMPIHSLKSITEMQIRNLESKPLNILARKLIAYQAQLLAASTAARLMRPMSTVVLCLSSLMCNCKG